MACPALCRDVPGRDLFYLALCRQGRFAGRAFSLALFDAACHFVLVAVFSIFGSDADENALGVVGEFLFGELNFVV